MISTILSLLQTYYTWFIVYSTLNITSILFTDTMIFCFYTSVDNCLIDNFLYCSSIYESSQFLFHVLEVFAFILCMFYCLDKLFIETGKSLPIKPSGIGSFKWCFCTTFSISTAIVDSSSFLLFKNWILVADISSKLIFCQQFLNSSI